MTSSEITGSAGTDGSRPTIYTTSWCPFCASLRQGLARLGVEYTEIDIEEHPETAGIVEGINGGNRTVPTVVYADGSTATNPAADEVASKVAG